MDTAKRIKRTPEPMVIGEFRDGPSTITVLYSEGGDGILTQEVDGEHTTIELSKTATTKLKELLALLERRQYAIAEKHYQTAPVKTETVSTFVEEFRQRAHRGVGTGGRPMGTRTVDVSVRGGGRRELEVVEIPSGRRRP